LNVLEMLERHLYLESALLKEVGCCYRVRWGGFDLEPSIKEFGWASVLQAGGALATV
jgi:hypothetical protein